MNLKHYIIFFIFVTTMFIYIYNKFYKYYQTDDKINANVIPTYKLGNNKYITSAHYIDYANEIDLIIYSDSKNINFTKCLIAYSISSDACSAKMQYEGSSYYYRIQLQTRNNEKPLHLLLNNLTIKLNNRKETEEDSFVVCVSIVVKLKRPLMLIQMLESYKNLGVSKIVINYYSSSIEVIKILNYYSKIGFVDIYQYNDTVDERFRVIENDVNPFIYYFQIWKINHCYYEYKTPSNHIMVLDVDEILWPVKASNYKALFKTLPKMDYYFLHQFFYKIDINIPRNYYHNITLNDLDIFSIKNYCPTSNGIAHKYIIYNTSKIFKAEVHFVQFKENINQQYIPNDLAYVRHTRHLDDNLKILCNSSYITYSNSIFENKIQQLSKSIYNKILNKNFK